ncbi:phosphotransferase [Agaribacter flavus]|uniref:Phosphotransferase n=1 Tax=Agaribacter flavus TaxID=1902781 RepID=A0ABV7FPF6_9ALTE
MSLLSMHLRSPEFIHILNTVIETQSSVDVALQSIDYIPVNAGAINNNVHVVAHCQASNKLAGEKGRWTFHFLAKRFVKNAQLPLDRLEVFHLQKRLASKQLAPMPLFLSDDHTLYIEEWVDIPADTPSISPEKLADTLWRIHSTKVKANPLNLVQAWQQYLRYLCDDNTTDLSESEKLSLQAEYGAILPQYNSFQLTHGNDSVLCHHDLHRAHVSGVGSICFDWEYAAVSTIYFDLACTIKTNEYSENDAMRLLQQYAETSGRAFDVLKKCTFEAMFFVNFTNKLWCLLTKDTNG